MPVDHVEVVADEEAAVDYAMERAAAEHSDISPLHVVCVLDMQMQYLRAIGAVGLEADTDGQA